VVDLDELDSEQAQQFLVDLFTDLSPEAEYETRHDDYVMEMPQSGERIRGRDAMRRFQDAFGTSSTPPTIQIRRVIVNPGLWFVEGLNDYGGGYRSHVVLVMELKDGKFWRETRYYADPFEAPAWREDIVERM
jgi:hypothetical protein